MQATFKNGIRMRYIWRDREAKGESDAMQLTDPRLGLALHYTVGVVIYLPILREEFEFRG